MFIYTGNTFLRSILQATILANHVLYQSATTSSLVHNFQSTGRKIEENTVRKMF